MDNLRLATAHAPHEPSRSYRLSAPNAPETAKVARDMVGALLHATDHAELADSTRLLVSEIVTNVHLHAHVPTLTLDATVQAGRVLVAVRDAELRGAPLLRMADTHTEHGRGLSLVQQLASSWGTTWLGGLDPHAKSVWFELCDGKQ